jgi:uncharacterized protein (TIRG00374 family)
MKRNLRSIVGFVISFGLICFLIYTIDYNSVGNALLSFDRGLIWLLLLIYIVGLLFRSVRWKLIIDANDSSPLKPVFKSLAVGYMVNNLLPAKVGELARMEYLKRISGISRSYLLGTIFIERILDLLVVFIFLLTTMFFSEKIRLLVQDKQWLFVILIGAIALFVIFMISKRGLSWLLYIIPNQFKNRIEDIFTSFKKSIQFIKNFRLLFYITSLSIVIWGFTLATTFIILQGLGVSIPFYAYLFVVSAGVFGLIIPSTSGGIGVYHAIATGSLVLFNVAPSIAMTFAIIAHAFDFIPGILAGGFVVFVDSVKIKKV